MENLGEMLRRKKFKKQIDALRIYKAMRDFQEVRSSCFGLDVKANCKKALVDFTESILQLDLQRIPTKV